MDVRLKKKNNAKNTDADRSMDGMAGAGGQMRLAASRANTARSNVFAAWAAWGVKPVTLPKCRILKAKLTP